MQVSGIACKRSGKYAVREKRILLGLTALVFCGLQLLYATMAMAQEYHVTHCLQGCPQGASAENHLVLRPIYALSYNTERKSADWVAYRVTAQTVGIASSLSRRSIVDNYVADTLSDADFLAAEELNMVRAQYAPLVNFAGTPYWNDVNYLTNAVATSSSLSRGAWYGLDWAIRNLANREEELYVVTGPLYDADSEGLSLPIDKPHRVPDGFFKIIATPSGQAAAFRFAQETSVGIHHCELQTSLAALTEESGLTFFPAKERLLTEDLFSSLGCI